MKVDLPIEQKEELSIIVQVGEYKTQYYSIPMDKISVTLRNDDKDYTSALFKSRRFWAISSYESAVILVPFLEDVELWEKELIRLKENYQQWLKENQKIPVRVLPQKQK